MSPFFLKLHSWLRPSKSYSWKSLTWKGLKFENPLGIAGGVDKNGDSLAGWWSFGAGFVELGTITPQPQTPNPGKIMMRNIKELGLWNKMGFPNKGMQHCLKNLQALKSRHTPVFANIGKNRTTKNEDAHLDYIQVIDCLNNEVDAFVLNISSPNTKNLRDLFSKNYFFNFLNPIISHNKNLPNPKPLLIKLSPDIQQEELFNLLEISLQVGIDGWIVSNTTTDRNNLDWAPQQGGISGKHLAAISRNLLKDCVEYLKDKRKDQIIISCGGVLTPEDVYDRLNLGADLVQVYSALVFSGPNFFKSVAREALS